jgi:hypothetical protein
MSPLSGQPGLKALVLEAYVMLNGFLGCMKKQLPGNKVLVYDLKTRRSNILILLKYLTCKEIDEFWTLNKMFNEFPTSI